MIVEPVAGRAAVLPAVILAGGLGTRLGPITRTTPKPLVTVAGRPILHWILTWLAASGVPEVLLLAGHLGDRIVAFAGDGGQWGIRARVSVEPSPLGTGGALVHAAALLPEAFLLLYGDSYLPMDYASLSHAFASAQGDAMMVVYEDAEGVTGVERNALVEGNRVTRYSKGDRMALTHIDAGVVAMRRRVIETLPKGVSALELDLYPVLAKEERLLAYPIAQRFYDVGTTARLDELDRVLRK